MRRIVYWLVRKSSSRPRALIASCTVELMAPVSLQNSAKRTESLAERNVEAKYFI